MQINHTTILALLWSNNRSFISYSSSISFILWYILLTGKSYCDILEHRFGRKPYNDLRQTLFESFTLIKSATTVNYVLYAPLLKKKVKNMSFDVRTSHIYSPKDPVPMPPKDRLHCFLACHIPENNFLYWHDIYYGVHSLPIDAVVVMDTSTSQAMSRWYMILARHRIYFWMQ